jgi:hypothetical protein
MSYIPTKKTKAGASCRQGLGLSLAALLIPACGYGSGNGSGYSNPMMMGGALLSDSFVTMPLSKDNNWTAPVLMNATASSAFNGAAYYLDLQAQARAAGQTASAATMSTTNFVESSVTFSVAIEATAQTTQVDTGSLVIENSATKAVLARMDYDSSTLIAHFMGTATMVSSLGAGAFHTFVFKVDSMGNASWTVDGGAAIPVTFAPGMGTRLILALEANFAAATAVVDPDLFFTSVLVTSP